MPHTTLKSSNLLSHSYDPIEQSYEVRFRCGACQGDGKTSSSGFTGPISVPCSKCSGSGHTGTYTFSGVPPDKYAAVRDAKSHGQAFNENIRGRYPRTKV